MKRRFLVCEKRVDLVQAEGGEVFARWKNGGISTLDHFAISG